MRSWSNEWPPVDGEELTWTPLADYPHSRTRRASRYTAAVPPMIVGLTPQPGAEAIAAAHHAANELSRFDAELGHRVALFAPVMLRSESASSSQIENLTASARAIFSAELHPHGTANARLITANTRALGAALDHAESISEVSIRAMHRVLLANQPRHTPGEWRNEAVWIGTRTDTPVDADFVAPAPERVPALIADMVAFAHRADIDAITAVALTHAQFETIHPFTDGNGRTGRALAQAMLRQRGVTRNVAVPVSAGLLADVDGYHRSLTAYRAGDISPIVLAFANASLRAVVNARELVRDIDRIRDEWGTRLTARRSSNAWRLLDLIARMPVLDAPTAARALNVHQANIYPPLQALEDAGILTKTAEHRIGASWRSTEILRAIDEFARRAGRREAPR